MTKITPILPILHVAFSGSPERCEVQPPPAKRCDHRQGGVRCEGCNPRGYQNMLLLEPSGSSTCIPQAVSSLSASLALVRKHRAGHRAKAASVRRLARKANGREPAADERRSQSIGGVGGRRVNRSRALLVTSYAARLGVFCCLL